MSPTTTSPRIQAVNIWKYFSGVPALKGVELSLDSGEVVGLLGENGAGKSTLINVLSGVYRPDKGTILIRGAETEFKAPAESLRAGIATVHQHSSLADNLTVAQNLVLGREPSIGGVGLLTSKRAAVREARKILDRVGIELPLERIVADLTVAEKQRVEIVRAAAEAETLIILDEPTAALNSEEVDELFEIIGVLKGQGIPVLYVSHRLDEIPRICDRVVVLRDGKNAGELDREHSVPDEIIPLLVGRKLTELFPSRLAPGDDLVFIGEAVGGQRLKDADISVRKGEIVGLTGAIGAGQRDLARIIFGAQSGHGEMKLDGRSIGFGRPDKAAKSGIGYVSGDRKVDGLFPVMSVIRNSMIVKLGELGAGWFFNPFSERKIGVELVKRFGVKAASPNQEIGTLSGGNQQKALLARWAAVAPKLLILDEPTLGVDVGARREIYDQIVELTRQGMSVLLVSSDQAELQGMSHRVLVFDECRLVAELPGEEATEEALLRARTGDVKKEETA